VHAEKDLNSHIDISKTASGPPVIRV